MKCVIAEGVSAKRFTGVTGKRASRISASHSFSNSYGVSLKTTPAPDIPPVPVVP